ncbi:MAG: carbamoyltransferase HypF [Desulfobacterales bacterium]|nr:MAG: carbamoyltransferase HypF [Desulfobacterales bacterium]
MSEDYIARRLQVKGIVQGVGFRPFVYQLAHKYGLKGEVANTSSGVTIHIEGSREQIECFEADLATRCPPLAQITAVNGCPESVRNYLDFTIASSRGEEAVSTLIAPDVSICGDCLRELFDPEDRRYHYPFINCTNCGPRYTIIDDIPYDRPQTSMKHFKMCAQCQAEYDDPADRRFHAQPNACALCGPRVSLYDKDRKKVAAHDPLAHAAALLKQGFILAIKGLGGFHLAADAGNSDAVSRLRSRKQREEKPLAMMSVDPARIRQYARVGPEEEKLLTSLQRPIVLLEKKKTNTIAAEVAPRNRYFGVMLPYTPLHYLLLECGFTALVMTSGNRSEEPIAIDNDDAFERLADIADYFLIHNRDIYLRSDDSIVRRTAGATRFIRRSRGYVPRPVFLRNPVPPILACGAELKNTVCLTQEDRAFLSQHIGDLENLATYEFFRLTIAHMERILAIAPEIVAYDWHPDYLSTKYAEEQDALEKIPVQHHHAHIVSCMAEHQIEGPVIGLALDGTGYGADGTVWGGEVLAVWPDRFERLAHFAHVPMPGSAAAIKEPWRMAVSYLNDAFGDQVWNLDLPLLEKIGERKLRIILEMIAKELNSPLTSSLGRLFDGVAAIVGIRQRVSFEGQAAMELEMLADEAGVAVYDYEWVADPAYQILTAPIVAGVVRDIQKGIPTSTISCKFHTTLVRLFAELCELLRRKHRLNRVVLSGGVFQNSLLLSGLIQALKAKNFEVFAHQQVPCNDGGIALGQALVAAARVRT